MRTKIGAAFLAGGLLVGAGFLTSVISAPGTAQGQAEPEGPATEHRLPRMLGFLEDVVADLVDDGTLTRDQADAVIAAAGAKAEEVWQARDALKERLRSGHAERWRSFANGLRFGALFDDGGIDQDEYDGLPEGHPLRDLDLDEYLEDGRITPDEFLEILPELRELRHQDT